MIEARLEFDGQVDRVVAALNSLSSPLRPVHFSHDEEIVSPADCIEDQKRFSAFLATSKSGFFLLGEAVSYSIRIAAGRPLVCDCFIDVKPEIATCFLVHMSVIQPLFGFACASGERESRNRVRIQQGVNSIESWVGCDIQKHVPGLYWLTLIPDALAKQHGIPLSMLKAVAQEYISLKGGQHLFRFYERPEDWQKVSVIDELCVSLPGIFDVRKIKPQLLAAKNFLDLNSMLEDWK